MKRFVEGVDRGQGTLFPERLEDWIGADNPERVIDVFVDELDLGVLGFGRVAPLLELGAGFHPDLSGLENILFNAMMLGLSRKEAGARTQRIVDFAELHSHIDAPVRTYSSGMQARLGFAIAINVDAEILIVDEVLSVGDFAFEQKCFEYMERFKEGGGAILFVTHALNAVDRFSDRCIWLADGKIRAEGAPSEIIREYQQAMAAPQRAQSEPEGT